MAAEGSIVTQILSRIDAILQAHPPLLVHASTASREALDDLVGRMIDRITEASTHLGRCRAEQARCQRLLETAGGAAAIWDRRAMAAVRAGDDIVARDAMVKKGAHALEAEEARASLQVQTRDIERLENALLRLNQRIEIVQRDRDAAGGSGNRDDADLLLLKETLAKGQLPRRMPLAKTLPGAENKREAGSGETTGIRRTKR